MRTTPLLLSLALATAAFAALPAAEASAQTCTFKTSTSCEGWVCVDGDADRRHSSDECVSKSDLEIDECQFRSDCCSGASVWCPDRS